MAKNPKSTVSAVAVMPMAEIQKLKPVERAVLFAAKATVSQRAFAEMGKLHVAISASLKPKESVYSILRSHDPVKITPITAAQPAPTVSAAAKVNTPPAPRKATAQDALNLIDALEVMLIEIEDEEALKPVVMRLVDLANFATEHVADNKDPHGVAGKKSGAKVENKKLALAA